jgi:hypothetical protein
MSQTNPSKPPRKREARSAVTNGKTLGIGDGRTKWARRFRDLMFGYAADLGGDEALTEMQRSMIRRAATLTCELERAELTFAEAGEADADALAAYQTTTGQLRRTLETLGVNRLISASDQRKDSEALRAAKVMADTVGRFTRVDWALCYGNEPGETGETAEDVVIDTGPPLSKAELYRRISFMLTQGAHDEAENRPMLQSTANLFLQLGLTPQKWREVHDEMYPDHTGERWYGPKAETAQEVGDADLL